MVLLERVAVGIGEGDCELFTRVFGVVLEGDAGEFEAARGIL